LIKTKYGGPFSQICALHFTHPSPHTHTPGVGSHGVIGGRCLAQGHLSCGERE